jgi:putative dehydrogenase, D-3- phosphoglycerate dehydrogenase-like protein
MSSHLIWQSWQAPHREAIDLMKQNRAIITQASSWADLMALEKASPIECMVVDHQITWDRHTLAAFPRLRCLVRLGVGLDNVDQLAARDLGIQLGSVPDYGVTDVSDHALALLLTLSRALPSRFNNMLAQPAYWMPETQLGFRLRGKRLTIVGLGRIGSAMAVRCASLGMEISFYDPYVSRGIEKSFGWKRLDTLELAINSDIVSLHCPLTSETFKLINRSYWDLLRSVGRSQVLINTARGSIVEWSSFIDAFHDGTCSHAGLDVYPIEPLPESDPVLKAFRAQYSTSSGPRLALTPHYAFAGPESVRDLHVGAAKAALGHLLAPPSAEEGIIQ